MKRSVEWRLASLLILSLVASACANATRGAVSRSFERDLLDRVPLRSVDVVVETGPVYRTKGALDPDAFPPPRLDAELEARFADPQQAKALERALKDWAQTAGFELDVLSLRKGATLADALEASDADAVLVVRGVPVDEFGIFDTKQDQRFIELGAGQALREPVAGPTARTGRLIVGQAYLFDRDTGLRLWSRQIPKFPNDGKLLPGDPFFAYGFVQKRGSSELDGSVKARRAARAFVPKILEDFPSPNQGDASALAELDQATLRRTAKQDAFYDGAHWLVELGLGWGLSNVSVGAQLVQNPLDPGGGSAFEVPTLGTGELAPNGTIRLLQPRATLIFPGGLSLSGSFEYGIVPGEFRRTLVAPAADPNADFDQFGELDISGGESIGFGADIGYAIWQSDRLLILPQVGLGYELLQLDEPAGLLEDRTLDRPHLRGDLGLVWRPVEDFGLYLRPSVGFRLGWQVESGTVFGGVDVDGAVGLMF